MSKKPTSGICRSIYLPPDVDKWLKKRIGESFRTLSAEVVFILKKEKERKAA